MSAKRDTKRYTLRDRNKIVYVGVTDDPERRKAEHERDGKEFTSMKVEGPAVTQQSAEQWEEDRLKTYPKNHQGKNPKYNKTK